MGTDKAERGGVSRRIDFTRVDCAELVIDCICGPETKARGAFNSIPAAPWTRVSASSREDRAAAALCCDNK